MESSELHTGAPTIYWENNTSFFKAKRVTPRVKHIGIPIYFILYQFYSGIFITKY